MLRRLKSIVGWVLYASGLYRHFWRDRAVIVFFHRVDDRYGNDPNTVTIALFRAFCDFAARYFHVVSLSELVSSIRQGRNVSGHMAITFDDGYLDNARVVAAELRQRRLPCCFFIAPGFIDRPSVAWWDDRRGIPSEWMTWDDVRSLTEQGFEIGAHTIDHVDLGKVEGAAAEREILGSKLRLEEMTASQVVHFCPPYGGPEHLTEANRAIIRDAGFSSCLSTTHATVCAGDDPMRLGRIGISWWYQTPYQFGLEALLRRRRRRAVAPIVDPRFAVATSAS